MVRDHGYADLTNDDLSQLSRRVQKKILEIEHADAPSVFRTKAKQLPSGQYACQFLRGTPGKRCSCSIYATRPEICSTFVVGGDTCKAARVSLALAQQQGSP
jgi:Fe-S-cluster containining protein